MNGLVPAIQDVANNINKLGTNDIEAIQKIAELDGVINELLIEHKKDLVDKEKLEKLQNKQTEIER